MIFFLSELFLNTLLQALYGVLWELMIFLSFGNLSEYITSSIICCTVGADDFSFFRNSFWIHYFKHYVEYCGSWWFLFSRNCSLASPVKRGVIVPENLIFQQLQRRFSEPIKDFTIKAHHVTLLWIIDFNLKSFSEKHYVEYCGS